MHGDPFAEQRVQIGCSLLHLTFEAAHASHEARSLGLFCLSDEDDFGAEIGEDMTGADVWPSGTMELCHCEVDGVKDIMNSTKSRCRVAGKLNSCTPKFLSQYTGAEVPPPLYITCLVHTLSQAEPMVLCSHLSGVLHTAVSSINAAHRHTVGHVWLHTRTSQPC